MNIKKILILAANPLETARLRLEKEVEEIRTTLILSPNRRRALAAQGIDYREHDRILRERRKGASQLRSLLRLR